MQDYMSWLWLGLTIVFVVVEACTSELVSVWFVAGSVAGLILSLFELPIGVQTAGFVAVALAALLAIRPLAMKRAKVEKTPTNADMVLGRIAVVTEAVDNEHDRGRVEVLGNSWAARTADDSPAAVGDKVRVLAIEGVRLIVEHTEPPLAGTKPESPENPHFN